MFTRERQMLRITEDAQTLISTLTTKTATANQSGLRIIIDPVHGGLSMSLAHMPGPTDSVVISGPARVFLSPSASRRLTKRTLHADISSNRSRFFLNR